MEGGGDEVKLLVASELAERWQVPTTQVYRLAREGQIPTVRIGRYRRFRLDHIEAFEARGGELSGDPLFDALAAQRRSGNEAG